MKVSERGAGPDRLEAWDGVADEAGPESWLQVWNQPSRLPVSLTEADQDPAQRPALTVLLVDDDPRMSGLLARRLELDGHLVSELPGVRSALAALERASWDLIAIDAQLGELPVRALIQQVRARLPGTYLVLTARDGHDPTSPCRRLSEIDAVLPKPWTRAEFDAVLAAAQARQLPRA